jgi:hypothetical protein
MHPASIPPDRGQCHTDALPAKRATACHAGRMGFQWPHFLRSISFNPTFLHSDVAAIGLTGVVVSGQQAQPPQTQGGSGLECCECSGRDSGCKFATFSFREARLSDIAFIHRSL